MIEREEFDAIVIGGSYAGLSGAMCLGRSLRRVLVLDSGQPCNRQTPHSHNFLTQDGETPAAIAQKAREQVLAYPTVTLQPGKAVAAARQNQAFEITTEAGHVYTGSKLLLATGVKDLMPPIHGFAECWGISILHCPYCHGYEVAHQEWGILANGDTALELVKLLQNWTPQLTVFTNGKADLTPDQRLVLEKHHVTLVEQEIASLTHAQGQLRQVNMKDGTSHHLNVMFARPAFEQHCKLGIDLGCELTETGHLKVDPMQKTNVPGVFAAGDAMTMFRTVSFAVATGTMAGAAMNKELIEERF
ncbi:MULTISPECIES: NAD(P)/FAD-dependent oxidoreductase [Rufibacter]|uniref:Thioredoxin reductase n=1 Tax=Rufibacter quisquiliarum TaxID=1549639 RepID=A0A839GNL6_9BACT|nr:MULTISPECIES: NAD(P)/FAD-dependent oxidoreductase [Rufibacter]MBA9076516.1 thioredoxin reductase [Rufibacter quisquiliarum]